jgi:hypothetical protein
MERISAPEGRHLFCDKTITDLMAERDRLLLQIDEVRKAGYALLDIMARRGPLYPEYAEPIRTLRAAVQTGCVHVFMNYQCEKCGKGQDMEKKEDDKC